MRRALTLAFAALGIVLLGPVTFGSAIASAHSVVVSSSPENESTVDAGPTEASVTFNEAVQSEFASLTVVGPDGNLWSEGAVRVSGPTVAVDVRELGPTGTYTIAYRVTSADGHPVSGTRTFELTTAGSGTPGPAADSAVADSESGVPVWPFLVGAAVVFVVVLALTLRRKR